MVCKSNRSRAVQFLLGWARRQNGNDPVVLARRFEDRLMARAHKLMGIRQAEFQD